MRAMSVLRGLLRIAAAAVLVVALLLVALVPWLRTTVQARLVVAAEREWATVALVAFDRDPARFLSLQVAGELERLRTEIDLLQRLDQKVLEARLARDQAIEQLEHEEALEWIRPGV